MFCCCLLFFILASIATRFCCMVSQERFVDFAIRECVFCLHKLSSFSFLLLLLLFQWSNSHFTCTRSTQFECFFLYFASSLHSHCLFVFVSLLSPVCPCPIAFCIIDSKCIRSQLGVSWRMANAVCAELKVTRDMNAFAVDDSCILNCYSEE